VVVVEVMTVTYANLQFMWGQVIDPRVGDVYVFGGSLSPTAVNQGTDCSGACSEVNEALLFGPAMNWTRQFWTGTFAGAVPGDQGPFGAVLVTADWICTDSPHDVPTDAAAIFSILQLTDPSEAHMVCAVPALDGSGLVGIEAGGSFTDANGNSTLHIGSEATSIYDPMFNQFLYLPGPIVGWPGSAPTPDLSTAADIASTETLTAILAQFTA
jgi:hypothetical protein